MNDFLIYAARLQDAGVSSLWVSLGIDKEHTRVMHVSPGEGTPPDLAAKYPTRTFELCGTDRVLERLKDDLSYSDDGPTPAKVAAAVDAHPLLRDDLLQWFADWQLMAAADESTEIEGDDVDDAMVRRLTDRLKHTMRGIDIARRQDAAKST